MKQTYARRGFTLIELLVVVLIIGILATIALPQYQKSVAKARAVEIVTTFDALTKAMQLYALGETAENATQLFNSTSATDTLSHLGITIPLSNNLQENYQIIAYWEGNSDRYSTIGISRGNNGATFAFQIDNENNTFSSYGGCDGADTLHQAMCTYLTQVYP